MGDQGNPELLEDIFNEDSDEESVEEEETESTADLILRAAKTLGEKSGFLDKWIQDREKQYFYSSQSGKLICCTAGKYLEYTGVGRYVPYTSDGTSAEVEPATVQSETIMEIGTKTCWVTEIPQSVLTLYDRSAKRFKGESEASVAAMSLQDFLESAESRIQGVSDFAAKWGLEESLMRHLIKLDRLLVGYIVQHFSPVKAKAKNALQGMIDSLLKYPQKWRVHALKEQGLLGECATRHVQDSKPLLFSSDASSADAHAFTLDTVVRDFGFEIFNIGRDFFLINSRVAVSVDGMRVLPFDGPVSLFDGSVVALSPYHLLLVEIGDAAHLISRRNIPD